jgi:hypothetical protein
MTRSTEQANSAIKIAALVVAGVYLYRRFTEGSAEELKASEKVTPLGRWLVGWGVVFFGLSVAAGPFPGAAGDLAILMMVGSLLSNGVQISKDLNEGLQVNRQGSAPTGRRGVSSTTRPSTETRTA